ncbi:lysophospholipid acyltransferase family protein [Kitasatospora sp. NPDC004240]
MLSRTAAALLPVFADLTVSTPDGPAAGQSAGHAARTGAAVAPGSIVAANHTSLTDPAVVLAALHRLGVRPVALATAGLWRIPLLGRVLRHEGFIPVRRGTDRAADSLAHAERALADGEVVLIYGEGGLPRRRDPAELPPGPFRTGLARLALATGAPVVPLGQAGARRLSSGGAAKQLAGLATGPLRRPALHVHLGAPIRLDGDTATATAAAHAAVTEAWTKAVAHLPARSTGER